MFLGSVSSVLFVVKRRLFAVRMVSCFSGTSEELRSMVQSFIPPLNWSKYKGQDGRIGVIGGSQEYTGAPYYAAISALKVGADLSHVFCPIDAAVVIKSYSPELIVHPLLDKPAAVEEISEWLPRLHALVIGPGLGRDSKIFKNVKGVLEKAITLSIPIVIDADGVYFVSQEPDIIRNNSNVILTPNIVEFNRLYKAVIGTDPSTDVNVESVYELCRALCGVTIVKKGQTDVICDGKQVLVCDHEGSPRRCGGQGDLLSGSMGTFTHWANMAASTSTDQNLRKFGPTMSAAYAACLLTRECNRQAYQRLRRVTSTTDMVDQIGQAFEHLFC